MRDEGGRNGASIVGINKGTAGVLLLLKKKSEENGGKTRKRIMLKRMKRESRTKRKE